jgi:hypothetical protein
MPADACAARRSTSRSRETSPSTASRRASDPGPARLVDGRIEVVGSLTFPFSDFAIEPPNIAGFVSVESEGTLEFLLVLVTA